MPKYLLQASYTLDGVNGLLQVGGTARSEMLCQMLEGMGGSMEACYYAFGDDDLLLIAELPDDEAATSFSLFISAAGALTVSCTVLLTPETIDAAVSKSVAYRKPGD